MPYTDDLATLLATTLNRACDSAPENFAGFAATREFWVAQAAHCFAVINGYPDRFERMKSASAAERTPKVDWPSFPITHPALNANELDRARRAVRAAIQRFLGRCANVRPRDKHAIMRDAKRLGVSI